MTTTVADHHHDEVPKGITRWLFTTNHKDIGTLYLWFSFIMFLVGGAMALVIRAELFQPGLQVVDPHFYNQMVTVHALIMIFGAIMPGFVGFANWMIPMMIGAPDMALPRMNNWSFWLLPFATSLLILSLFVPGGGPAAGWTIYPPLSVQGGMGSALLSEPEKVRDILTTLVRNLGGKPVTCKIRLLESPAETLQLCRTIAECGVAALAVHARRRHDRPRHWAQWDQVALLRDALPKSLPLVLNGDVFSPDDVPRALAATGADALMLARGAMWNPSLFDRGRAALAPPHEVVGRYVELAEAHANSYGNTKYVCMQMLEGYGKTAPHRLLQKAKDYPAMRAAVAAMRADPAFAGPTRVPTVLEPAPDLPPERTVALPVNAWRHVAPHVSGLLKRSREAAEAAAEGT